MYYVTKIYIDAVREKDQAIRLALQYRSMGFGSNILTESERNEMIDSWQDLTKFEKSES